MIGQKEELKVFDKKVLKELKNVQAHLQTRFNRIEALLDDLTKPKPELWGVWCRYLATPENGSSKLRERPLGVHEVLATKVQRVTLRLVPQMTGKLREVRVFGGPWLIHDVAIGKELLLSATPSLGAQGAFFDDVVQVGHQITVNLMRPVGF